VANEDVIRRYPTKRVSPFDGMAVTARVWADAHEYHRTSQQIEALLGHGPGILTGLEVLASDPPDSSVYVRPGIARDPAGQIIVVAEPVRYDLGHAEGPLHLLLSYGEGRPMPGSREDGGATYIQAAYAIEARPDVPQSAALVELARIWRRDAASPIVDAQDPLHPSANEVDVRFRREIGVTADEVANVAVTHLGEGEAVRHARGASSLARALRQGGRRVYVDEGVVLGGEPLPYTLVYLVAEGAFQADANEMNALYGYVQGGGTLLVEACRQDATSGSAAEAALKDLLGSLGISLEPLPRGHDLLTEPHLFAAPPTGFEMEGTPEVLVSDSVIYSTIDYGCLWQGECRGRAPSREEIRAALEWGANIVAYAMKRRNSG
jgi:hypothetical protein